MPFHLAAGAFQFTPLKNSCLTHCRGPLEFIMTRWRDGWRGAFAMGLEHGTFCTGCCWALMILLFVAGVMNLLWIYSLLHQSVGSSSPVVQTDRLSTPSVIRAKFRYYNAESH